MPFSYDKQLNKSPVGSNVEILDLNGSEQSAILGSLPGDYYDPSFKENRVKTHRTNSSVFEEAEPKVAQRSSRQKIRND